MALIIIALAFLVLCCGLVADMLRRPQEPVEDDDPEPERITSAFTPASYFDAAAKLMDDEKNNRTRKGE